MSKRPTFGAHFERLRALGGERPLDERKPVLEPRSAAVAPEGGLTPLSSILGNFVSKPDPVIDGHSQGATVSGTDSVEAEPPESSNEFPSASPESAADSPQSDNFSSVPNSILRSAPVFGDALDLMIYLRLFAFTHGWPKRRSECEMGQGELSWYTGASKNTVKQSLDRLQKNGWIKCVEEYEAKQVCRRWRVIHPDHHRLTRNRKRVAWTGRGGDKSGRGYGKTGSKSGGVGSLRGPGQTQRGSNPESPTGSESAPYEESSPKEFSKNSLTATSSAIRDYFADVKPFGKRQSEWRAYQGLRRDYSEEQVAACLERLRSKGIPVSGTPCHSPMRFLTKAMGQVWGEVALEKRRWAKIRAREHEEAENELRRRMEDEVAEQEVRSREEAFERAFPNAEDRAEVLTRYLGRFPMIAPDGQIARSLAIGAWWAEGQSA